MTVLDRLVERDSPAPPPGTDAFERWSALHEGFAPLYCATVMRDAFEALEPAIRPGDFAADLGCGTGHAADALAMHGGLVAGLDLDPVSLRLGRGAYPRRVAVAGRLERLPFADQSLDAAFSFSAFQYVDHDLALRELHRVLKPGGRFAIVENLSGNPVARLFRAVQAIRRARYRGTVPPLAHISWAGRDAYTRVFPATTFRTYHVFSPLLLASGRVLRAPGDLPARAWLRRVVRGLERFDEALLRWVPGARGAAWLLLATGRKT